MNENLCPPFNYLHFKILQLYKNKIWKGKLTIKMNETGKNLEISHIDMIMHLHQKLQKNDKFA